MIGSTKITKNFQIDIEDEAKIDEYLKPCVDEMKRAILYFGAQYIKMKVEIEIMSSREAQVFITAKGSTEDR